MALIICEECGKEYSNKASACPSCGCPTPESDETAITRILTNENFIDALIYLQKKYKWKSGECYEYVENFVKTHPEIPVEYGTGRTVANNPKCPTCGSTDLRKITATSKVGSALLFGIFAAGKVSKTWHCNNCNSEW